MRQFHDSYKSNFWQIFSIWPNCAPLAPTHSSHSLLNRQRFVEVDLCWPLHARLAHIYLPPFPFPLPTMYWTQELLSTMPPTQNKLIRKRSPRTFPRLCTTAYTLKTWKVYYTYQGQRGKFTKQCFCTVSGQPPLPVKKPLQMHILLLLLHFGRTNTVQWLERGK